MADVRQANGSVNVRRKNEHPGERLDQFATPHFSITQVARALGGKVIGRDTVRAPGPGHSRADDSLVVWLDAGAPEGFRTFSHAGDDWRVCCHHVRAALGIPSRTPDKAVRFWSRPIEAHADNGADRIARAIAWWQKSSPLPGTMGERYLVERRHLPIDKLGDDLSHVLRWHAGRKCIVALMTDPVKGMPTGVHRTFLANDGSKIDRRMLGRQGIVRLSPDDDVTLALGLTEGVEDGVAVMLTGWAPVWAATSAGAIARFPALGGIEALTLFADADTAGITAATVCAARWHGADRQAEILPPRRNGPGHA
jgi:putative DNA primase/helicase